MQDPIQVCDLHHSSQQCWILNPLSEARDWTYNLIVPSQIRFHCTMVGTLNFIKFFFLISFFSQPHLRHMEVPKLGIELELQLPAYTTATAILDLSYICDLGCSQILNPLSEARDWTHILMDTSRVLTFWATTGTLLLHILVNISESKAILCHHSDVI